MSTVEERIAALGLVIPVAPVPLANYVSYVVSNNQVHISGQVSGTKPENFITGPVTEKGDVEGSIDLEKAREASKVCIINFISQLKAACDGDLEKVARIVKINVFVHAHPTFGLAPVVANAASDILVAVFGEAVGKHARAALGVAQLPFHCAVEIDGIVELKH